MGLFSFCLCLCLCLYLCLALRQLTPRSHTHTGTPPPSPPRTKQHTDLGDGKKRYASYNGRFEDAIVRAMVRHDGGDGDGVQFHGLDLHGYMDDSTMEQGSVVASYLAKGGSDSTWIFSHWEGILARRAGQALTEFRLEDHGVPYGYAPVLLAHPDALHESEGEGEGDGGGGGDGGDGDGGDGGGEAVGEGKGGGAGDGAAPMAKAGVVRAFLGAVSAGYKIASEDPARAAAALGAAKHPSLGSLEEGFLEESAAAVAGAVLTPGAGGEWGSMDGARWGKFVDFLDAAGILVGRDGEAIERSAVDADKLFTNAFLPGC